MAPIVAVFFFNFRKSFQSVINQDSRKPKKNPLIDTFCNKNRRLMS